MIINCNMKYHKGEALLEFSKYTSGDRKAMVILDPVTHETICIPTVNIPEAKLAKNEILIKDWSENEGVLQTLVENGIVKDTGKTVKTGFVNAHVCELLKGA
jgi:hypothetical protein